MPDKPLTHIDPEGRCRMVDVSAKMDTMRKAVASGMVRMKRTTLKQIQSGNIPKGEVLAVARVAGIMAAKNTAGLIPLCHPIPLSSVEVDFSYLEQREAGIQIRAVARSYGKTGVEMEALAAVSAAALTIYDMCKAVDRAMSITAIELQEKTGGQSGKYERNRKHPSAQERKNTGNVKSGTRHRGIRK